ncbi:LysE family translocator [Aureimonas sp. AU12]|uniref:LysE family translocator n=1 Tax=Aureimonas sp. AU12 TaxID=1638161 RepID=UPI0007858324|nr:LysE family transporter [Aureimonas sp. AU12]
MPFSPQTADLLAFAGTYSLVVATPGPNLFVVVRASLSPRRHAGLAAALGVAAGAGFLALLSSMLATTVSLGPAARPVAHAVFAGLLILMGWRAVAAARCPAGAKAPPTPRTRSLASFGLGFATAATNPMSAVFFGTYLISGDWAGAVRPAPFEAALVAAGVAFLWFGCVGTALSNCRLPGLQPLHLSRIDGALGIALCGIGVSILLRL